MAETRRRVNLPKGKSEEEVVRFANGLISKGIKEVRETGISEVYQRGLRYLDGNHKIKLRDKSKGNSVWNKFAEISENTIAHLTDALPKFVYRPQADDDVFTSKMLNQVVGDVVFDYSVWEDAGRESVTHSYFAGLNHIKTLVDPNGYPRFVPISVNSVIWGPKHAKKKKQLKYICHFVTKPIADIERDYGVKVAPSTNILEEESSDPQDSVKTSYHASSANTMPNVNEHNSDSGLTGKSGEELDGDAVIAEIWMEDPLIETIPFKKSEIEEEFLAFKQEEDHNVDPAENHAEHLKYHELQLTQFDKDIEGRSLALLLQHIEDHKQFIMINDNGEYETKRRRYPKGRIITVCQKKLLRDEPVEGPLHWRDIWIKWDYISFPDRYYGKPGTKDLFDPQDDLNHRKNSITMNINLLLNGIRKVRQGLYNFLKGKIKWDNLIGKVIPVNNENDVSVDFGKPLPDSYFNDIVVIEGSMDRLAGHNDIKQGRMPAANTASITVQQLNEEGSKRLRASLHNYARALEQMARNAAIVISDEEYGLDDQELLEIMGPDNMPQGVNMDSIRTKMRLIKNIRIDTKSMLPTSRMESLNEAIMLKNAGVYDNQAVLNRIDDDQKFDVMQRMSEILQLQTIVQYQDEQLDMIKKENNTMMNRLQSDKGDGNVGVSKTSD